jgi:hypothetical protein
MQKCLNGEFCHQRKTARKRLAGDERRLETLQLEKELEAELVARNSAQVMRQSKT